MAKSLTTLTVRYDITDEQLIKTLKKVLPDLLVKKMGISRTQAEQAAEDLAYEIVNTARICSEQHLVGEVSNKINLNAPSKQECDDFKRAVDEIIQIRLVKELPKRKSSVVKTTAGKLWLHLRVRILGLPPLPEEETINATIGPRG